MHLILVTETFPPDINGVARTLGRWVDAFHSRGHRVQVIRPRQPSEGPGPDRVPGFPLSFYREVRIGLATPGRLRRMLGAAPPQLIHVATEGPLGFSALRAAHSLGLPVVTSFHTNYDEYMGHYGLGALAQVCRHYLRWFHNSAALTLVPGEPMRQRLLRRGHQRVEIWPRGVDIERFHPRFRDDSLRASLGLGPADVLLLYVGRLAPEKNLLALVEAFERLRLRAGERASRLRLALVGGGPLESRLQAAPLPGIVLPGVQRGEALSRWYASADLFAFPSLTETFGNVLLEAQASGLPIVGFDGEALRARVTPGQDSLLVPPSEDMADALLHLATDSPFRRHASRNARHTAEQQTWGPIFDTLEARYAEVIARASRPSVPSSLSWFAPRSTDIPSRRS